MQTQNQLRTTVYDALLADTPLTNIIGTRLNWIARPTAQDTYPLLVYKVFDTVGAYSFGDSALNTISEDFTIQIDAYTDPSDITNMDTIIERLKIVMVGLCFRNISSPVEFLETDINKIVRSTRWEIINV